MTALALLCIGAGLLLLSLAFASRRDPDDSAQRAGPNVSAAARARALQQLGPAQAEHTLLWRVFGVNEFARPLRALLIVAASCVGLLLTFIFVFGWLIVGVGGSLAAGLMFPRQIGAGLRAKREIELEEALAESVAVMRDLIRAGNTVPSAISLLGSSASPLLQPHFADLDRAITSGIPFDVALAGMQEQLQHNAFDMLAQAITTAHQSGGQQISRIMDDTVNQLRDGASAKRKARSTQVESVMMARALACLPVLVFVGMQCSSDEIASGYDDVLGQVVLCVIIAMTIGGYLWMMKIVNPGAAKRLMRPRVDMEAQQ